MSDIEGAICDECGSQVGPHGCCSDARRTEARANAAIYHNAELRGEIETYRKTIAELRIQNKDIPELAARIWGLNDQVEDLKDLLIEARTFLPSEEDILNYAASSETGGASLEGILVRKIEAALLVVR